MAKSVKGTQTEKNLLTSFAGESQARMRYTYFASVAKKEGYEQIAAIFTETADQEKEHAKRMFKWLEGEQRLRKEDIYWEMPRCYQWDITVNLPEGYRISPEGLERLNVKVENDCGAFIVQATTEDGTLRIKAEKRINHKTEPVANWEKLLEITDAANSYEALSIVFQATINPPTSPTTGY